MIAAVWPDVVVTDDSLIRCIGEVRRAIGDEEQATIKTVPRRGYLFQARGVGTRRTWGRLNEDTRSGLPAREETVTAFSAGPSIVVLPFANLAGDPAEDYLSNGITEDIITELSRFSELRVIARHSSFHYKDKEIVPGQIGRELGVGYVLQGSVRRGRDRVRITAQLMDASTGSHLWAERYDRSLDDVFAIQDELVRTIAPLLVAHVRKAEVERTLLKPPATWQAYHYFMRGLDLHLAYQSSQEVATLHEARRLLRAIDRDRSGVCAPLQRSGCLPSVVVDELRRCRFPSISSAGTGQGVRSPRRSARSSACLCSSNVRTRAHLGAPA